MAKDYYALLGIPRNATADQIKSAYRRQAKRVHPDACIGRGASAGREAPAGRGVPAAHETHGADGEPAGNVEGGECFQDVHEAYETLSDPERRRAYDRQTARGSILRPVPVRRAELLRRRAEPLRSRPRTPPPVEPLDPEPLFSSSSPPPPEPLIPRESPRAAESLFSLGHPLETLWELGASLGGDRVEQLYAEVYLTPDQAEWGGQVDIAIPLQVVCPECRGWGGWGLHICPRCAGRGRIAGERPLSLSFPGGIVDGQVARLSLDPIGMPGVVLTVRLNVERW